MGLLQFFVMDGCTFLSKSVIWDRRGKFPWIIQKQRSALLWRTLLFMAAVFGCGCGGQGASHAPNKQIAVIIPDPVSSTGSSFGSIGTIGGQNCFDIRNWNGSNPVQGTFSWWFSRWGQFYNTDLMAAQLKSDVVKYSNIKVYYGYDIKTFASAQNPTRLTQVTVCNICRDTSGVVVWGNTTEVIPGSVFIDASDDGRLTRLANFSGTVGRYDWPTQYLEPEEIGPNGKARQQAATLMFKVRVCSTELPGT